ncbi:MAG: hypothetical protein ACOH1X_07020 [Kaistella sp.]
MTRKIQLYIVALLLAITAIAMVAIGIKMSNPAPALTGAGFILIVWAILVLIKDRSDS